MPFREETLYAGKGKLRCHIAISVVSLCLQEIQIILSLFTDLLQNDSQAFGRCKHPLDKPASRTCPVAVAVQKICQIKRDSSPRAARTFSPGRDQQPLQKAWIRQGSAFSLGFKKQKQDKDKKVQPTLWIKACAVTIQKLVLKRSIAQGRLRVFSELQIITHFRYKN